MRFSNIAALLSLTPCIAARAVENLESRAASCPAIWSVIAADLRLTFLGCGDPAASALRFAFHDAAGYSRLNPVYGPASGGADGSLLLNTTEIARPAENPMQGFWHLLSGKYQLYKAFVSAADFVQFAAAIGATSCPGAPVWKVVVGRQDDSTAAPDGNLPDAFGPGSAYSVLVELWENKGINERELAALMGAHTISRSVAQTANGIPAGSPQDTTNTVWDTKYYNQTQAKVQPKGVYSFNSDLQLAQPQTNTGRAFTEFGGNKTSWDIAFTAAMYKLSVMGIPDHVATNFIDCTDVVKLGAL